MARKDFPVTESEMYDFSVMPLKRACKSGRHDYSKVVCSTYCWEETYSGIKQRFPCLHPATGCNRSFFLMIFCGFYWLKIHKRWKSGKQHTPF